MCFLFCFFFKRERTSSNNRLTSCRDEIKAKDNAPGPPRVVSFPVGCVRCVTVTNGDNGLLFCLRFIIGFFCFRGFSLFSLMEGERWLIADDPHVAGCLGDNSVANGGRRNELFNDRTIGRRRRRRQRRRRRRRRPASNRVIRAASNLGRKAKRSIRFGNQREQARQHVLHHGTRKNKNSSQKNRNKNDKRVPSSRKAIRISAEW